MSETVTEEEYTRRRQAGTLSTHGWRNVCGGEYRVCDVNYGASNAGAHLMYIHYWYDMTRTPKYVTQYSQGVYIDSVQAPAGTYTTKEGGERQQDINDGQWYWFVPVTN